MTEFPYKVKISPAVISQEVLLGETILMDMKSLAYFGLDDFGSRMWKSLVSCADAQQVFEDLRALSDLDEETFARKFNGVMKGLEMSRIITLEPRPAG